MSGRRAVTPAPPIPLSEWQPIGAEEIGSQPIGVGGWRIGCDVGRPPPELPMSEHPCELRTLQVWSLSDDARSRLQACPDLITIDVVEDRL